MTRIRYMGNKHALAGDIVSLAATSPTHGPLIDIFCGLCSIGGAFAGSQRQVWGNDIQQYAALAARCQLVANRGPARAAELSRVLVRDRARNTRLLERRFAKELAEEDAALASNDPRRFTRCQERWRHAANDTHRAEEIRELARERTAPDRLFTLTFAWGYFGLRQAIAIDSIRHAIDWARERRELTPQKTDWALLALLEATSVCASTPGHFAQFLRGRTPSGLARVRRQRRRDIWQHFLTAADQQQPFGKRGWRAGNAVFNTDALTLWPALDARHDGPAIVYADPPYSKDQYSRYYHVLETLVRYDYPDAHGLGRYRPDRFHTPFSQRRHAPTAFETLFARVAERGWTLILSYPSTGLLDQDRIDTALRSRFSTVAQPVRRPTAHSTLGARHGPAESHTEELIWVAA